MQSNICCNLHHGILYDKLPDKAVHCNVCLRRCIIQDGSAGFCNTRVNKDGMIYSTIYGVVSSIGVDPIEKKPVYHYLPGSLCFSMGSFGCNFRCNFCQNWNIAYADGTQIADPDENRLSPEKAVELALENKCRSISWTYNEPSIWLEYTIDCARLAKENGLRTVYVTNGYMTPEALDMIAPYLDVFRVDIKSFDNKFYQKLIKIPGIQGILNNTINAKKKWNMHVETVTNIIPGWNDSDKNLKAIAEWIYENLGELTPWHVTRFFPQAKMMDIEPTPPETLQRARQIGLDTGLKFVYTGNIASGDHSTYCPSCRKKVIDREGYSTRVTGVTGEGECTNCNYDLGIVNF